MIKTLLKKTPAFIWHIKHWYLITGGFVIDQICKQKVTISVFWALEALFVAEKSFVVNQNDKDIIEEDSSFHLTYQTLISDHWWLHKLIKLVNSHNFRLLGSRLFVCYWKMFCCYSKWLKIHWRRLQLSFDISNIDIWSLVTLVIDQIGKQTVMFSDFWAT